MYSAVQFLKNDDSIHCRWFNFFNLIRFSIQYSINWYNYNEHKMQADMTQVKHEKHQLKSEQHKK